MQVLLMQGLWNYIFPSSEPDISKVILEWNMDFLQKRLGMVKKDTDAFLVIREYKRFLVLLVKYPNVDIIPPPLIERCWHEHLVCTEDYQALCKQIGKFIHHRPSWMSSHAHISSGLHECRMYYAKYYHCELPEEIWCTDEDRVIQEWYQEYTQRTTEEDSGFEIVVKDLRGSTFKILVYNCTTFGDLKMLLTKDYAKCWGSSKLLYIGREYPDFTPLVSAGICDDSAVFIVYKLN